MKCTQSQLVTGGMPFVALIALGLACSDTANASPAVITIQVNNQTPITLTDDSYGASGDFLLYLGEYVDPDGQWSVSWDKSVNPDPYGNAAFVGSTLIENTSDQALEFTVTFEMPICPSVEQGSLSGGFVVISLATGQGGGQMTDIDGESVWSYIIDGEVAQTLYDPPFYLGSTGQGTATLNNAFGTPFPGAASPPIDSNAGIRHQFQMTPGEKANISSTLVIGAAEGNLVECQDEELLIGDLNDDGVVDVFDLLILFGQWGPCQRSMDCPADLNGDGVVDMLDLLIVLDNWT